MSNLLTPQARQTLMAKRTRTHGAAGAAWVEQLPHLIEAVAEAWSLTLQPPFANLSYNYVCPVLRQDGTPAVLKLVLPDDAESASDIQALRHFSGRGCVRLIDFDSQLGAVLIQRADPGLPVSTLHDDSAEVRATASVMLSIQRPLPQDSPFPTMAGWFENAAARAKPDAERLAWMEEGIALGRQLCAEPGSPAVVLHGDLHHDNVLSANGGWLCIDPKGVVGEPAWEVGPYLYNNLPDDATEATWRHAIRRRADQFSEELGLDRQRLYACSAAYAALSCAWSSEEDEPPEQMARRRAVLKEQATA